MATRIRADDTETIARAIGLTRDFRLAVDGGAHRGSWTAPLAERFQSVHAFEPAPDLCDRLAVKFEGAPHVSVHHSALSDHTGEGELAYPPDREGKRRSAFIRDRLGGSIRIERLDDLSLPSCGLLKLDIEGGEYAALCGAERLISVFRPVIVVECKPANAKRHSWTRSDLELLLSDAGYYLAFEAFPNLVYVNRWT